MLQALAADSYYVPEGLHVVCLFTFCQVQYIKNNWLHKVRYRPLTEFLTLKNVQPQ